MKHTWMAIALCVGLALAGSGCQAPGAGGQVVRDRAELIQPTEAQQQRLVDAYEAKGSGNYDEALGLFNEILGENPTVVTAYIGIGDIYMDTEEYEMAEPAYARAALLDPFEFDAQYGHGLALQMLGRLADATRAYLRALNIKPNDGRANLNLATTYLRMDEARNALPFAQAAMETDPGNGPARVNLGAIYEQLDRDAEAIEEYLVAMELMEHSPPLMMNLINALARERRYREAVSTAQALVRIEDSANAYERLGWCYFRLGEYANSIEAYRNAVQVDPSHWPALNGVGINAINRWLLSDKMDESAYMEAQGNFRRSLRVNPRQTQLLTLMSNFGL